MVLIEKPDHSLNFNNGIRIWLIVQNVNYDVANYAIIHLMKTHAFIAFIAPSSLW